MTDRKFLSWMADSSGDRCRGGARRGGCRPAVFAALGCTAAGEVAERFRHARRILNHLAGRYLPGPGSPWFTAPG